MNFDTMYVFFKGDRYNPVCVPYEHILHLDFQNMTNAYFLDRNENSSVNSFKSKIAEKVFINIHKDANTKLYNSKYKTAFDKLLNRRDIFYLEFFLGQDSIKKIRVPWNNKTNFEEFNELEHTYLCPYGNLGIKVKH